MVRLVETRYESAWWPQIVDLRLRVYVDEQGVPLDEELDALDSTAIHWAALEGETLVGTARLVLGPDRAKFGRLAVERTWRRRGLGSRLLRAAVARARTEHLPQVILDAQTRVTALYEGLGFTAVGEVFLDAGIEHIRMIRDL